MEILIDKQKANRAYYAKNAEKIRAKKQAKYAEEEVTSHISLAEYEQLQDEAIQLVLMLIEDLAKELPDKERKLKDKILKGDGSLSKNAVAKLLSEPEYGGCYNCLRKLFEKV